MFDPEEFFLVCLALASNANTYSSGTLYLYQTIRYKYSSLYSPVLNDVQRRLCDTVTSSLGYKTSLRKGINKLECFSFAKVAGKDRSLL